MISLTELYTLESNTVLLGRITAACWLEVKNIFTEPPGSDHIIKLTWAVNILKDDGTDKRVSEVFKAVLVILATNPVYPDVTTLLACNDTAIQTAVQSVIKHLAMVGI